jgi:hypothetical protein
MNRLELIGDLVWPVDVWRDRTTGRTIGKAMLAVSHGVEGLHFVPLTLYDGEALDAAKYLGEGSRLSVTAHLHSVLVTDRDANGSERTRRVLHVIVDRITYLTICPPRGGDWL